MDFSSAFSTKKMNKRNAALGIEPRPLGSKTQDLNHSASEAVCCYELKKSDGICVSLEILVPLVFPSDVFNESNEGIRKAQ